MRTFTRPMFRKGGMTNQGSGILSHVEPRPVTGYQPIPKMPIPKLGFEDGGRANFQTGGAGGSFSGNMGLDPNIMKMLIAQNKGSDSNTQQEAINYLLENNKTNSSNIDDLKSSQKAWVNYGTRLGKPQATFSQNFTHPLYKQQGGIQSLGNAVSPQYVANGGRIGFKIGGTFENLINQLRSNDTDNTQDTIETPKFEETSDTSSQNIYKSSYFPLALPGAIFLNTLHNFSSFK